MNFLRLLRFPNLVVVALTQWLISSQIFRAAYQQGGITAVLCAEELLLLILATICLTASGYVVNDLIDYPIDLINRPEKLVVGKVIAVKSVYWIIALLSLTGFGFALTLALLKDELAWLWLFPVFTILLILYPSYLKTRPFLGNLFISFCCAGTAGLVWLAERSSWSELSSEQAKQTAFILLLFMGYAFLATWIRELIKDLEDMRGDQALGRQTFPVRFGKKSTKIFIFCLSALLIIGLIFGILQGVGGPYQVNIAIISFVLICGVFGLAWLLYKAQEVRAFHRLSQLWKFFLLGGLVLLFCYKV